MKKKLIKTFFYVLFIVIFLGTYKVYATNGSTINETTRLRKEASTTSEIIKLLSQGDDVQIISEEGDWYKVKYEENIGYLRKDMLSIQENQEEDNNNLEQNEEKKDFQSNQENNKTVLQIGYTGKLKSKVNLKIIPSITSNVIAELDENTEFYIGEIINKWCYVQTEDVAGWVFLSKIDALDENVNEEKKNDEEVENIVESEESKEKEEVKEEKTENTEKIEVKKEKITKYVATETLNVREKAENNAKIVSQLSINTVVTVEETVDSTWSKVTAKGITGYVASKYLSDSKQNISSRSETEVKTSENSSVSNDATINTSKNESTSATSTTSISGENIVAYAKQYLGYKYVSGGASPSTGFDCSGFTSYVYKHFGISISRTSTAQASNGTLISKSNLQLGDLIIFNGSSNSSIGHVGIYIGGNMFIHAANPSKGVITTSLSDSYYAQRYVSARRIIN